MCPSPPAKKRRTPRHWEEETSQAVQQAHAALMSQIVPETQDPEHDSIEEASDWSEDEIKE